MQTTQQRSSARASPSHQSGRTFTRPRTLLLRVRWSRLFQVRFVVCGTVGLSVAHAVGLVGLSAPSLFVYTLSGRLSLNFSGLKLLVLPLVSTVRGPAASESTAVLASARSEPLGSSGTSESLCARCAPSAVARAPLEHREMIGTWRRLYSSSHASQSFEDYLATLQLSLSTYRPIMEREGHEGRGCRRQQGTQGPWHTAAKHQALQPPERHDFCALGCLSFPRVPARRLKHVRESMIA
ncbi:hypothetical protein BC826DRAFT_170329 [Russula brevipes]|nr:hypothetical protein BC826DRAFT_170329 [Russula brevipes]